MVALPGAQYEQRFNHGPNGYPFADPRSRERPSGLSPPYYPASVMPMPTLATPTASSNKTASHPETDIHHLLLTPKEKGVLLSILAATSHLRPVDLKIASVFIQIGSNSIYNGFRLVTG
jgi:hypothetical protein